MDSTASDQNTIRLNKFLAERLGISRRQADNLITNGMIGWRSNSSAGSKNDWQVATLGDRIDKSYEVCYNGGKLEQSGRDFDGKDPKKRLASTHGGTTKVSFNELPQIAVKNLQKTPDGRFLIPFATDYLYFGFNKPVGYVCSRRAQGDAPTIYDLLPESLRTLKTVGRLDKDSSGLILLTNDGDFAYQMTHPKFVKEKVYLVELDRDLAPLHQQEIADFGIEIGDGISRLGLTRLTATEFEDLMHSASNAILPSTAPKDDSGRRFFRVTMNEGRNRQIRRTFAALGYQVVKLHRVCFGKYCLDGLKSGEFVSVPKIK